MFSWDRLFDHLKTLTDAEGKPIPYTWGWVESLMSALSTVMWILLALVGAAGGIYAIYVGIKMARAESAEARDENKKRLINIIVSIIVVVVLILFFNVFLPAILNAFGVFTKEYGKEIETNSVSPVITAAKLFLRKF